jgi:putative ABC transport system permease protein
MIKFVLQMFSHCFAGVEGNLAVQNLIRYRSRTELTAAVLFLSLAIMVTFGQTISDISSDLHQWCSQAIVADYVLRGSKPDNSLSIVTSLPESAEHEIEQLAGVAAVDKLSFIRSQVNGRSVLILARGLPKDGSLPLVIREGNAISAREALQRGEAMLGTALAQDLGLHAGDFIQINTAKGEQRVRVAGTVTEYAVGGMALFMEWDAARSLLEFQGVNAYMISAKSGEAEQLRQSLVRFSGERKYYLEHIGDLRSSIEGFLSNVTGVLWCLMVMVFVVASLSVVNTLFMNVRDQSRELGILRAIGLKQCQLKKVIRLQAVLLACTVIVPGIAVGLILSQAIETGGTAKLPSTPEFAIRGWVLIGSSLLALLVAGFAGILPARRAARMPVMAAMQS